MKYAVIFATALVLGGCLTGGDAPPIVEYTLEPDIDVQELESTGLSVGMRNLRVTEAYRREMAYMDEGLVLDALDTAEWAEAPADLALRALIDALVQTNAFEDVGRATDLALPKLMITGDLRKFYLDRTTSPWSAVVEMRLELRAGRDHDKVWAEIVNERRPLASNSVSAYPAAMSQALGQAASQAANQMAEAAQDVSQTEED